MSKRFYNLRLNNNFIPLHYEIKVDIDIINISYTSKVDITLESQIDDPKYITLNSKSFSNNSKITNYQLISQSNSVDYIIKYLIN